MLSALINFVLRVVFTLATVVLVLGLMGVAIVTMLGLVIWSLLRGRKPVLDTSGFARARNFRAGPRQAAKPMGEVIDVEVREVSDKLPPQQP